MNIRHFILERDKTVLCSTKERSRRHQGQTMQGELSLTLTTGQLLGVLAVLSALFANK